MDWPRARRFVAIVIVLVVAIGVGSTPAAAADPDADGGYRHASGLVVLPKQEVREREQLPDATRQLMSQARDLANSAPADFGYPSLDTSGRVVMNVVTGQGADKYSRWAPSAQAAAATRGRKDVMVSVKRFEEIRDDIAAQVAKDAPGFDHILSVGPDAANNRLIVTVNSIDDGSLNILAGRYGTQLIAVRHEPDRKRASITSGRWDDRSPGGFYAGSALATNDGLCSSAFSWRSLDSTISYMLTAGHCVPAGGPVYTASFGPPASALEYMGNVTANTRENWNIDTGTTHLQGDLASSTANRGDIALVQVQSGKTSAGYVYADPGAFSRRVVGSWVGTWSSPGDQFCTDGIKSLEVCGWSVDEVGHDYMYSNPDGRHPTVRGANRGYRWGSFCIVDGDSGGPIYTIDSNGRVSAKGIISGGSCLPGFYGEVIFTDVRDPYLGLPGTIKLG